MDPHFWFANTTSGRLQLARRNSKGNPSLDDDRAHALLELPHERTDCARRATQHWPGAAAEAVRGREEREREEASRESCGACFVACRLLVDGRSSI
jgi:hypothetical protein